MTTLGYLRSVREWASPTRTTSAFLEKGVLTPEEFVRAGDELVYRCPTWSWEGLSTGMDPSKVKKHLPADKQYLVTRGVPCQTRSMDQEVTLEALEGDDGEEGDEQWMVSEVVTQKNKSLEDDFDILDAEGEVLEMDAKPAAAAKQAPTNTGGDDEYADMDAFEDDNVIQEDQDVVQEEDDDDNVLRVRTYDLSITYDKYYQTPRVWMVGTSADQQPLTAEEMMEDVMKDYRNKTVTMEHHPHTSGIHASIHPCQHGKVMKTIIRNLIAASQEADGEKAQEPTVEMYLFIFLKFVNSIIPTINYDFTMEVNVSTQK